KTPEGAANSRYVHFLFGLIFKYEATTGQGHRSQGPNDTARPRRRGDRIGGFQISQLLKSLTFPWTNLVVDCYGAGHLSLRPAMRASHAKGFSSSRLFGCRLAAGDWQIFCAQS